MIWRVLGVIATLAGGLLVFAQFTTIADPLPGVRWNVFQLYSELFVGLPLLGVGLYFILKRRSHHSASNVSPPAA